MSEKLLPKPNNESEFPAFSVEDVGLTEEAVDFLENRVKPAWENRVWPFAKDFINEAPYGGPSCNSDAEDFNEVLRYMISYPAQLLKFDIDKQAVKYFARRPSFFKWVNDLKAGSRSDLFLFAYLKDDDYSQGLICINKRTGVELYARPNLVDEDPVLEDQGLDHYDAQSFRFVINNGRGLIRNIIVKRAGEVLVVETSPTVIDSTGMVNYQPMPERKSYSPKNVKNPEEVFYDLSF